MLTAQVLDGDVSIYGFAGVVSKPGNDKVLNRDGPVPLLSLHAPVSSRD